MKYLRKLTDVDTWLYISLWLFIGGTIYLMIALFHDSQTYLLEKDTVIDLLKQVIGVENKVK